MKIIFLRIVGSVEFRVKGSMLSEDATCFNDFPFLFSGRLESVKRYPNGTVTGTCPVVRGPDDEPEIGSQGSECDRVDESGFETSQFSSTFDLCSQDIKDRFFAMERRCVASTCFDLCRYLSFNTDLLPKILFLPSFFFSFPIFYS